MQRSWGTRENGLVKKLAVHQSGWQGELKGELAVPLFIYLFQVCLFSWVRGDFWFLYSWYLVPSAISSTYLILKKKKRMY